MRCPVEGTISVVEEQPYAELINGLSNPTFVCVLRAAPAVGTVGSISGRRFCFRSIDRMLGGGREPGADHAASADRHRVAAGRSVGEHCARRVGQGLERDRGIAALGRTDRERSAAARIAAPTDSCSRLGCELSLHASRGLVTLCIPTSALAQLAAERVGGTQAGEPHSPAPRIAEPPEDRPAEEQSRTATRWSSWPGWRETQITAKEMLSLRVGDIITTDGPRGRAGGSVRRWQRRSIWPSRARTKGARRCRSIGRSTAPDERAASFGRRAHSDEAAAGIDGSRL